MANEMLNRLRTTVAETLTRWAEEHTDRIPAGITPRAWVTAAAPVVLALIPGFALQRTILDDFDEDGFVAALPAVLPG